MTPHQPPLKKKRVTSSKGMPPAKYMALAEKSFRLGRRCRAELGSTPPAVRAPNYPKRVAEMEAALKAGKAPAAWAAAWEARAADLKDRIYR
jgi:hypothetical protein